LGRAESEGMVEFQLGYGAWIRLLRSHGFVVEDLIELRPQPNATTTYDLAPLEWARRWPAEHIWKARSVDASDRSAPRVVPVQPVRVGLGVAAPRVGARDRLYA
jgi:hypothetical protein